MPVKIVDKPVGDPDVRAITLDEFNEGRMNFNEHYVNYTPPPPSPEPQPMNPVTGQVTEVPWEQFYNAVAEYMSAFPEINEADIALRFVHCYAAPYNTTPEELYYRLQICYMGPQELVDGLWQRVLKTDKEMWFVLRENTVEPTDDYTLVDQEYMDMMGYRLGPAATSCEELCHQPNKFVHNLVLPWYNEILEMYNDNAEFYDLTDATVKFAAYTIRRSSPILSNVEFPHGIVVYLWTPAEGDLLNNNNYIVLPFEDRGADCATLCPPKCGVYVVPASVSKPKSTLN